MKNLIMSIRKKIIIWILLLLVSGSEDLNASSAPKGIEGSSIASELGDSEILGDREVNEVKGVKINILKILKHTLTLGLVTSSYVLGTESVLNNLFIYLTGDVLTPASTSILQEFWTAISMEFLDSLTNILVKELERLELEDENSNSNSGTEEEDC